MARFPRLGPVSFRIVASWRWALRSTAIAVALSPGAARAQLPVRAVQATSRQVTLRVGSRAVDAMRDPLCTIERYDGEWAWITTDDAKSGWVKRDEVVPLDGAVLYFTRKISAEPNQAVWRHNRGLVFFEQAQYDQALNDLNEAIRLGPREPEFRSSRGIFYLAKHEYDAALKDFNDAIRLAPDDSMYWANAGTARAKKGEWDKAVRAFDQALSLDPTNANAYNSRGNVWADQRNYDEALKDYDEAIRLDPEFAAAYRNRGTARADQRHYEKALADYDRALQLDATDAQALDARAWLLATCPEAQYRDGKQAVVSARHACELVGWNNAQAIATLAAAYAEASDFDNAVNYGEQALSLASNDQRAVAGARLKAYRAGQAWREKSSP